MVILFYGDTSIETYIYDNKYECFILIDFDQIIIHTSFVD